MTVCWCFQLEAFHQEVFFHFPEDEVYSQRQRSRSVQYSPRPHHADTLDIHYNKERTSSDQHGDSR